MSTKKYKAVEHSLDVEITMIVDTSVLTPELATHINTFWSDHKRRLDHADGDVTRAVIKLFAHTAMRAFLDEGGIHMYTEYDMDDAKRVTQGVLDYAQEGWPPVDELGILITQAYVCPPDYEGIHIEEVD